MSGYETAMPVPKTPPFMSVFVKYTIIIASRDGVQLVVIHSFQFGDGAFQIFQSDGVAKRGGSFYHGLSVAFGVLRGSDALELRLQLFPKLGAFVQIAFKAFYFFGLIHGVSSPFGFACRQYSAMAASAVSLTAASPICLWK